MIFKKKYHGGLLAFCFLCFVFLFGNCSNSFARTTLNIDEAEYIINYIFTNQYNTGSYVNLTGNGGFGYSKNNYSVTSSTVNSFLDLFNNNNTFDFDVNSTIFFVRFYNNGNGCIYFSNFNNGKINNLPHLYLFFNSNKYQLGITAIDDNKNVVASYPIGIIDFGYYDNLTFTAYREGTISASADTYYTWSYMPSNWNSSNLNTSLLENISGIVSFSNTNAIYTNYNGNTIFNSPQTRLLQTLYIPPTPPEPPEPENTTGNITNNSGEVTGSIDLSGIENGITGIVNQISGDTQKIIDNQNQNTNMIVNALSGETQKIIDNSNQNLNNVFEFNEDETSSFEEYYEIVSGDFKNPYDIDSINQDFLNSFDSSMEEDFIISWNGINFSVMGSDEVPLIPSGEINFSALCRENETIGTVKHYLSLFCVCSLGILMLKEFYNMLLATLGIGSYFYANTDEEELHTSVYYDMETGRSTTTYHGHAEDGSNINVSYNHSRVKPHRRIGFK